MSAPWAIVLVTGMVTVAFKGAGPLLLGGRRLPARVGGVLELLAPTLLAALIVVNAFSSGRELVVDARAAGLVAAAAAIVARAPLLAVIAVAALASALTRAL